MDLPDYNDLYDTSQLKFCTICQQYRIKTIMYECGGSDIHTFLSIKINTANIP